MNRKDEVWVVADDDDEMTAAAVQCGAGVVVVSSDPTRAGDAVRRLSPAARRVAVWLEPGDVDGLRELLAELYPGATVAVQSASLGLADLI